MTKESLMGIADPVLLGLKTWGRDGGDLSPEKATVRDFPGCPVVRTPNFHCRGHGFHPWSGN